MDRTIGAIARASSARDRLGPCLLFLLIAVLFLAGRAHAASYVWNGLGDVKPDQKVATAHPQPVQLIFQFQTHDAPNARATKYVMQQVRDTVKDSGLFSDISDGPTANGAVLSIVIDNIVAKKALHAAEAKGALTGATMFLAGSNIWDHYTCQIDYVASPTAPKLTRTAEHAIVFQMGLINHAPDNAVKVEGGLKGAVFTMVRQIVSNPLNALAGDPAFQGPVAAAAAPMAPAATPATTPAAPTPGATPAAAAPTHP